MEYGIYYAYWEKEWAAEYTQYVKKAEKLGFDILEIGASLLPEYSKEQIQLDMVLHLITIWDLLTRRSEKKRLNGLKDYLR